MLFSQEKKKLTHSLNPLVLTNSIGDFKSNNKSNDKIINVV